MEMDERWVNRSPEEMRDTFHAFHGETFPLLVEDLAALREQPPILVEGLDLLPRLVQPLLSQTSQAVWLIPTPEFRRAANESRGSTYAIAGRTSDPERALANLLERDRLFTDDLAREVTAHGLSVINVDVEMSVDDLVQRVAEVLALAPPRMADVGPGG
jgi:2-phosphoglycerate kinase